MPLFICSRCGIVDNTALSLGSWPNRAKGKPMLCSACCPDQMKWHGRFERRQWDGKEEVINRPKA